MAALNALDNYCDLNITPSRKRKRQFDKSHQKQQGEDKRTAAATSCFTNAAFSSTPRKILGKRRLPLVKNKENDQIFPKIGLEEKSIADIAKKQQEDVSQMPVNPFEVVRKPPKKKKRHAEETACFENPALNLDLPEKQFNPYEVVRDISSTKVTHCFSNAALNLKVQDFSAIRNPYEVARHEDKNKTEAVDAPNSFSITTESDKPKPCNLQLGLPFVPTVGCRIDFRDISMSQLTPTKLLAEKLVFSPLPKGKTSLGSIGEETTMDIGKELDRYQLELENSINEAKLRKNGIKEIRSSPPDSSDYQIQVVEIDKTIKFTQKLSGIAEDAENESANEETSTNTEHHTEIHVQNESSPTEPEVALTATNPFLYDASSELQKTETAEVLEIETENLDDLYGFCENDAEDSFDFKAPATFVRAYTKPSDAPKLTVSKESLESNKSNGTDDKGDQNKKTINVKNIIRKSIRKLMQSHQLQNDIEDGSPDRQEHEKHNGFINAIRQSLRRKPYRNILDEESITAKECEISIIDSTERTMKLKSDQIQTEYVKVEDLTNEKKHNLRNSIRKSTREVRNQFMKTVFHRKHEEYDFNKS